MNCVIVSILNQHDEFMEMPTIGEEDMQLVREFVEKKMCAECGGGSSPHLTCSRNQCSMAIHLLIEKVNT